VYLLKSDMFCQAVISRDQMSTNARLSDHTVWHILCMYNVYIL